MEHEQRPEPQHPKESKIPFYKKYWFEKTIPAYLPALIASAALIVALANGLFEVKSQRLELQKDRLQFDITVFKQEKASIEDSIRLLKGDRDSLIIFSISIRSDLDSINRIVQNLKSENVQFSNANKKLAMQLRQLANSLGKKLNAVYENTRLSGTVTFNYSNNNGRYIIGRDEFFFVSYWSKASSTSIYVMNDFITGVALALDKKEISEVTDPNVYDFSSRHRTPQEGEIVILRNYADNYAILKIIEIKDRTRPPDLVDELTFDYVILKKK